VLAATGATLASLSPAKVLAVTGGAPAVAFFPIHASATIAASAAAVFETIGIQGFMSTSAARLCDPRATCDPATLPA
jgi:hypothetical protein